MISDSLKWPTHFPKYVFPCPNIKKEGEGRERQDGTIISSNKSAPHGPVLPEIENSGGHLGRGPSTRSEKALDLNME